MTTDTRRFARSVAVDISVDNTTWLRLHGRVDNAPQITPTKQDSTDTDTSGWKSMEITLQEWVLGVKYNRLINGGTPNVAQDVVDACIGQFGDSARLYVRWYDTDGGTDGWTGRAVVEKQRSKTGVADLYEDSVTFTGDGVATRMSGTDITNALASAAVPVVTAASPSGVAAGGNVVITGQGFSTLEPGHLAAGVKFGGTNAASYIVISDSKIVAVMPAGSAGSAVVVVTNTNGASNSLAYTRGA